MGSDANNFLMGCDSEKAAFYFEYWKLFEKGVSKKIIIQKVLYIYNTKPPTKYPVAYICCITLQQ